MKQIGHGHGGGPLVEFSDSEQDPSLNLSDRRVLAESSQDPQDMRVGWNRTPDFGRRLKTK